MDLEGLRPLAGGYSGETFLAESGGTRTVVRLYERRGSERDDTAVEVDAAVLRLVRNLLPVPDVLDVRPPNATDGTPGRLVTSFLPGERLDSLLPDLDQPTRGAVARNLGEVIGRLAQMPMPRAGQFVDARLRIEPWAEATSLPEWVDHQRRESAIADWQDDAYEQLLSVAGTAQALLDEVDRTCLVHSDFNPKNLLVDPATGALTGLLDWEFAHAGSPAADLGNLLRFDREPEFVDGVVGGYLGVAGHLDGLDGPGARGRLLDRARAADLLALLLLAGRRTERHRIVRRADAQLRAIAATGDLHATA
ncbi:MAG: phosphotransferase family protein [Nocardioidaceae bacterium]